MAQDTAEVLKMLTQEMAALKQQLRQSQPNSVVGAFDKARAELKIAQDEWRRNILCFKFSPESHGIVDAFLRGSQLELEDLGPDPETSWPQAWFSHVWKVSYPALRDFLATCQIDEASKAALTLDSFGWDSSSHKRSYFRNFTLTEKHAELWDVLSTRATEADIGDAADAASASETVEKLKRLVPSRAFQITDLSPLLSSIILASVPLFNQSAVASFFDRYLSGASAGKALLTWWDRKISAQHAYCFEYHVSFFYVPDVLIHPDLPTHDFRRLRRPNGAEARLRRGTPFTHDPSEPSRWIYEEQRSFLVMGCGPYLQTSIQLAENYFTGPFVRSYGRSLFPALESQPRPSRMFLDWLSYTMHLVNGRWHKAIEAVNSCIHTASDIIFIGDHLDLLSDDPRFSRSKTYFWALQAYKMFDEKLSQTIDAWNDFREYRLMWVNDGQFDGDEWDQSIARIQKSIDALEIKRSIVRSKSEEVRHLREGLFGASSLFDSRTAVRQGDNIRLLTWITILFLPLTFVTSIFGMQVILPPLHIHVFIITLPTVFLITAFVLFNASNLMSQTERLAQWIALRLRRRMKKHHHHSWKAQLNALLLDKQNFDAPVHRVSRQSSHWTYLLFCVAMLVIDVPVHEVTWFLTHMWLMKIYIGTHLLQRSPEAANSDPEASPSPVLKSAASTSPRSPTKKSGLAQSRAFETNEFMMREKRALQRSRTILSVYPSGFTLTGVNGRQVLLKAVGTCISAVIATARTLLQFIWIPLICVEYFLLLPLIALDPFSWFSKGSGNLHGNLIQQPLQWLGFGVAEPMGPEISRGASTLKQAVITYQRNQKLWEQSDAVNETQHWKRLRQRRTMPATEKARVPNGNTSSPPTSQAARADDERRGRSSSAMGRIMRDRRKSLRGDLRSSSPAPSVQERGRARLGHDLVIPSTDPPISNTPAPPRLVFRRSLSRSRQVNPTGDNEGPVVVHESSISNSTDLAQYLLSGRRSQSRPRSAQESRRGLDDVADQPSSTTFATPLVRPSGQRSRSRQRDEFADGDQLAPAAADEAASDYHTPALHDPSLREHIPREEQDVSRGGRDAVETTSNNPLSSFARHLRSRSTSIARRGSHDIEITVTHAD